MGLQGVFEVYRNRGEQALPLLPEEELEDPQRMPSLPPPAPRPGELQPQPGRGPSTGSSGTPAQPMPSIDPASGPGLQPQQGPPQGANPYGIDPEIYKAYVHPALDLMNSGRPEDRRDEADAEKRKARLSLLADALRQTVQAAGGAYGASLNKYQPNFPLRSMENYKKIMDEQLKAEQAWELGRTNRYLDAVGKAREAQMAKDRDELQWNRQKPYKDAELGLAQDRLDLARRQEDRMDDTLEHRKEQDKVRAAQGWARVNNANKGRAEEGNLILDPTNRHRVLYRLSDAQRIKAEEMVLAELTNIINSGEGLASLDARTVQLLMNRASITSADRWDLVNRWWNRLPSVRRFVESGERNPWAPDRLGLFTPENTSVLDDEEDPFDMYPDIDFSN